MRHGSLFTANSLGTCCIHHQIGTFQHDMQPGTAKTFSLPGELPQPVTQRSVVCLVGLVAVGSAAQIHQQACLPLTQPKTADNMGDRFSLRLGL